MCYIFISSVFITLFLVIGTLAFWQFIDRADLNVPLGWTCYQHVFVLAIIAVLCFIAAVIFGTQIPECYATTVL